MLQANSLRVLARARVRVSARVCARLRWEFRYPRDRRHLFEYREAVLERHRGDLKLDQVRAHELRFDKQSDRIVASTDAVWKKKKPVASAVVPRPRRRRCVALVLCVATDLRLARCHNSTIPQSDNQAISESSD
jgi:hypothetical protein